jgi:toxin ParE1/3/4
MSVLEFSPKAVADLESILKHIAQDKPRTATSFVAMLKEKCQLLASSPAAGTLREDLLPDIREFSVGNYVIYFRPIGDALRIERVLHGARDVGAMF